MLISLKAGGVALNLTVASRIFLMGKLRARCFPCLSPALSSRSIDSANVSRVGQIHGGTQPPRCKLSIARIALASSVP